MGAKIMGLDELDDFLRTSPVEIANGPIRKALKAGGDVLQKAIVERAPVLEMPQSPNSTALPPGALKGDITLKVTVAQGGGTAVVEPGKFTRHVARWVEYGHHMVRGGYAKFSGPGASAKQLRGAGKWLKDNDVPPHPFIRPAVEAAIDEATRVMYETFGREMAKIARRKLRRTGGRAA